MARAGQNMSTGKTIRLDENVIIKQIPDTRSKYNELFTDGIGMISKDLVKKIQKQINDPYATAFQVRLRGCKGMLV